MPSIFKIRNVSYLLLVCLFAFAGCVKESTDDCPPEQEVERLLYFKVYDVITGADVSATESLDDIRVYFFNSLKELIDTLEISERIIREGIPLNVTSMNLEGGYVSVWSNISESMDITPAALGEKMENMAVNMSADIARDGYFVCPGDIYFGYEPVHFTAVSENTEADTVVLRRKNGKLYVTVRGLETADDDEYYFRIGALYSGYDFEGKPESIARLIREVGAFDPMGYFTSPAPYIMIHHPQDIFYDDINSIYVYIYREDRTRGEDKEIARANRSDDGEYIAFKSGMTTNVLIEIQPAGDVEVSVKVTPWDEIHQWVNW